MIWVSRNYVHVDRVVCPWLIKRFIDLHAQFVFLPKEKIADFVKQTGAIPFDAKISDADLDHYEENGVKYCSFDAIIKRYQLEDDEALQRLRKIVRGSDTGKLDDEPLAWGLEAIASGAPLLVDSDHEALEMEFPFYDAIYAFLQSEIVLEQHKEELEKLKTRGEKRQFLKTKVSQLNSRKLV